MDNVRNLSNLISELFNSEEIAQINSINQIENDNTRHFELRKLIFTNLDIYNKIKPMAEPAWLAHKLYSLAKGYEF